MKGSIPTVFLQIIAICDFSSDGVANVIFRGNRVVIHSKMINS